MQCQILSLRPRDALGYMVSQRGLNADGLYHDETQPFVLRDS